MEIEGPQPLLTTREAAMVLGISQRTLEDWHHHRRGPPYIRVSRTMVRYRRSDLDRWIESVKIPR